MYVLLSPKDNSWDGGLLRGLQNLVPTKASRSNIIGPCFKIGTPSFSSFVHELCVLDCATLSGNKMLAVIKLICVHFFYILQCLAFRAEYLFICGTQFSR